MSENQNNSLSVVNRYADEGFSLVVDMTSAQSQYCSVKAETPEEKAAMFNAMNNPQYRLADYINKTINAKDLYVEVVNCTNEETGEVTPCPRIVIIDIEGNAFQCVSIGIYSAIKKVIQIFGEPTWKDGIKLEVVNVTKGNRKMLTLRVAA